MVMIAQMSHSTVQTTNKHTKSKPTEHRTAYPTRAGTEETSKQKDRAKKQKQNRDMLSTEEQTSMKNSLKTKVDSWVSKQDGDSLTKTNSRKVLFLKKSCGI